MAGKISPRGKNSWGFFAALSKELARKYLKIYPEVPKELARSSQNGDPNSCIVRDEIINF